MWNFNLFRKLQTIANLQKPVTENKGLITYYSWRHPYKSAKTELFCIYLSRNKLNQCSGPLKWYTFLIYLPINLKLQEEVLERPNSKKSCLTLANMIIEWNQIIYFMKKRYKLFWAFKTEAQIDMDSASQYAGNILRWSKHFLQLYIFTIFK